MLVKDISTFMLADADYESELRYWDEYVFANLEGPHALGEQIKERLNPELMEQAFPEVLWPYLEELSENNTVVPKVLDVGCGPVSSLIYGALQGKMELTPVDPLADDYAKLLEKYNFNNPHPAIKLHGEDLSARFGEGQFDLTWTKNAIDHSLDPCKMFAEIVKVTRPGGLIYLWIHTREATYENWNGLHQHDIYLIPSGDLVCETKKANRTAFMTQDLPIELIKMSEPTLVPRASVEMIWRKQ